MLCIYYIQESGRLQCRSDKLFVNIRFSARRTRRTGGKRPADRCGQGEKQIPGTALQPCRERLRDYEDQKVTAHRALRALQVLS